MEPDVPLIVPEVNSSDIASFKKKHYSKSKLLHRSVGDGIEAAP